MSEQRVTIEMRDGVAEVRLNRADKLNALDPAMFDGIVGAIDRLGDMTGLRAVVLSGAGRGFCAGLDMASMATGGSGIDLDHRPWGEANIVQQVAWGWRRLAVPVISVAHGMAFGGGFQIFCGADVRFAVPGTRLSIMETKWGIVPDMAGFALWRSMARDDVVRELAYTAREFTAEQGAAMGFVTHVEEDAYGAAMTLAREIAGRNPEAVRAAKRLANLCADAEPGAILKAESDEQRKLLRTPNQMEAVMANMQKRAPSFTD